MDKNTAKENIIELKNISRTFDDGFCVVDDFNLTTSSTPEIPYASPDPLPQPASAGAGWASSHFHLPFSFDSDKISG